MSGRPQATPSPGFGEWFAEFLERRGLNRSRAANVSGRGQSTISSYVTGVRKPRRSDDVIELLRPFLLSDADTESSRRIVNDGLRAAGFLPVGDTEDDLPDDEAILYFNGLPEHLKPVARATLKALFESQDREDEGGSIGKKA